MANFCIYNRDGPAAEIDCRQSERLVHGHHEISSPQNAQLLPQSLVKSLTQGNPNIFHSVMLIDVEIALRQQPQIKPTMPGKQFQHVIKEPNPRRDLILTAAIDIQRQVDASLVRIAQDSGLPHATTSAILSSAKTWRSATRSCSVCASEPSVIRTQPLQPGSEDRSRTRIPRRFIPATNAA